MIIQSQRVFIEGSFIKAAINIEESRISRFYPYGSVQPDVDYGDRRIVPGFIDIHCHGAYGQDTNVAEPSDFRQWASLLPREGVTSFCPTSLTQSMDVLEKAMAHVASAMEGQRTGQSGNSWTSQDKSFETGSKKEAEILGIHLEGPFINPVYGGAQPKEAIIKPSTENFDRLQEAAGGNIRIITLAPEMDQDHKLIRHCAGKGVRVSMGHTAASYEEAVLAAADGAVSITHTYNAQSPFHHRNNGVAGAALRLGNLYSEIICDCIHSTAEALNIFFSGRAGSKAIMVTDSLLCKGCDPGEEFFFGGNRIKIMEDHVPHLMDLPGKDIAGSVLFMNQGLKNLVEKAMVPFDIALNSCTLNPAAMLGLDHRLGRLKAGYDADIVVLNDDYSVHDCWCKGKRVISETL